MHANVKIKNRIAICQLDIILKCIVEMYLVQISRKLYRTEIILIPL